MGKKARDWAIEKFSTKNVGKSIEEFLDQCKFIDDSNEQLYLDTSKKNQNPKAEIDASLSDNLWIKSLYQKILDTVVEDDDEGFLYWMNEISKNTPRQQIENYFRHVAQKDLLEKDQENKQNTLDTYIVNKNKKKLLYVMPRSIGDCFLSTAIFGSLRKMYPVSDWDLYVSSLPEYKDIFNGNPNITNWIPYSESMENHMLMEGIGDHKGWFDICFTPHISTQRSMNYIHNGTNKLLM
jgi:hypothetical protein